jgi:myo-inositol-1-phosphate synthase
MSDKKKVRAAIIGVGNCASSLVQGFASTRGRSDKSRMMHVNLEVIVGILNLPPLM